MTSPVDFISGPRIVSTPGNRENGRTASLTATCGLVSFFSENCANLSPAMTRAAIPATGNPIALATKWHGARRPRIDLQNENVSVLDGELHIHQPAHLKRPGKGHGLPPQLRDCCRIQ